MGLLWDGGGEREVSGGVLVLRVGRGEGERRTIWVAEERRGMVVVRKRRVSRGVIAYGIFSCLLSLMKKGKKKVQHERKEERTKERKNPKRYLTLIPLHPHPTPKPNRNITA